LFAFSKVEELRKERALKGLKDEEETDTYKYPEEASLI